MDIRTIDVHDDAQFHDFFVIRRDALLAKRPDAAPMESEREAQVMFRREEPAEAWQAVAAYDGDRMVGAADVVLPLLDNTHMVYCEPHVAPSNRRRGIGAALLDRVVERTRQLGRSVLLAEAHLPLTERDSHPYAIFARQHGFTPANVEVRRDLLLPVSDVDLAAWAAQAAPYHQGYRLQTFFGQVPAEFLESYCYLLNRLAVDAPTGDIEFEPEGLTPHAVRVREEKVKEQGQTLLETLAVDATGRAVAQTTLAVSADDPTTVMQWGTLVHPEHRGHRLGLAVKTQNLRAVQEAFADPRRVVTSNSEENDHMLAINLLMGFEPVELLVEFQRKL